MTTSSPRAERTEFTTAPPDCCDHPSLDLIATSKVGEGTPFETTYKKLICRSCSQKWESKRDTPSGDVFFDERFAVPSRSLMYFRHLSD